MLFPFNTAYTWTLFFYSVVSHLRTSDSLEMSQTLRIKELQEFLLFFRVIDCERARMKLTVKENVLLE